MHKWSIELWRNFGVKVLPGSYLSNKNHHSFEGTFPKQNRTKDSLVSYSGRIVADIDLEENRHLLPARLEELKQQLGADPYVEAVCVSLDTA